MKRSPKVARNESDRIYEYDAEDEALSAEKSIARRVSSYIDDENNESFTHVSRKNGRRSLNSASDLDIIGQRAIEETHRIDLRGADYSDSYPDGDDYEEPDEYGGYEEESRRRAEGKSRGGRAKAAAKKPKKKRKLRVGRIIAAFILLLVFAVCLLLIIPTSRNVILKWFVKTEAGEAVVGAVIKNSEIGSDYEANVYDADFDSSKVYKNTGVTSPDGYYTFALLGLDTRSTTIYDEGDHTDSMIVISLEESTGKMKMASISRDTFVYLRTYENEIYHNKANTAYVFGGVESTLSMLNENFDLAIEDYWMVNFAGLENIINAMGGLTLEITEEEMGYINFYLIEQRDISGENYEDVTEWGEVTLNGAQVTAFCRIRYCDFTSPETGEVFNSDWGRVARQRYVLSLMLKKAQTMDVNSLIDLANELFEANTEGEKFLTSSMEIDELSSLVSMCLDLDISDQQTFPVDDHLYTTTLMVGDVIIPDTLEENVTLLHEYLYGEEDYEPTDELKYYAEDTRDNAASTQQ